MILQSQDEYDQLRAAYLRKLKGERVSAMTFGDQSFQFDGSDDERVQSALLTWERRAAKGSVRYAAFRKGA